MTSHVGVYMSMMEHNIMGGGGVILKFKVVQSLLPTKELMLHSNNYTSIPYFF